jgi:hypothetical protein
MVAVLTFQFAVAGFLVTTCCGIASGSDVTVESISGTKVGPAVKCMSAL